MTTSCGKARRLLWPDAGPRAVTAEVEAAEQHLARCEECRAFLEEMRHLAGLTHHLAPRPQAPGAVKDRIFETVTLAGTGSSGSRQRGIVRWLAVAAVTALATGLTLVWRAQRATAPDPMTVFVDDHLRATRGAGIASSDSGVVVRWLTSRLPFAMDVPRLPNLELRGARLWIMDGRRGGVVEYSAHGRSVSYFVVPSWPAAWGPPSLPGDVHLTSHEGYHVAAWQEPGLVHALVGDLPEATLAELARLCMAKMMAFLDESRPRAAERWSS